MLTATVHARDIDERRDQDRAIINRISTARDQREIPCDVVVCDFSRDGIGFTSSTQFAIGSEITIGLSGGGTVSGRIVRRQRNLYGCAFAQPLTHRQMEAAFGVASSVRPFVRNVPIDSVVQPTARWSGARRVAILATGIIGAWSVVAGVAYLILA